MNDNADLERNNGANKNFNDGNDIDNNECIDNENYNNINEIRSDDN